MESFLFQKFEDLPGRVTPRLRTQVSDFRKDPGAHRGTEEARRTLKHGQFRTLHIHLDEIDGGDSIFLNELVQGNNVHLDGASVTATAGRSQAVATIFDALDEKQSGAPPTSPKGLPVYGHIPAEVETKVSLQQVAFAGRRLDGMNTAARMNAFGGEQRVEAVVRADIKHSHAGAQATMKKMELRRFETAAEHTTIDVTVRGQIPASVGQRHWNGHGRKSGLQANSKRLVLLPARLLDKVDQ